MAPERRRDILCLLLLAMLSVGFLWPVTIGSKVMLPADLLLLADPWAAHAREFADFPGRVNNPILDAVNQFYPWRAYARKHLLNNTVPLWNPHQFCGTPFVANNSSAVFYPETWLHCLMPAERALGWASALFLFLAGAFMFGFLRTIGCRAAAALFGAIAFMANGFFVGWLCFPSVRSVFAWLPLILMAYERAIRALPVSRLPNGPRAPQAVACAAVGRPLGWAVVMAAGVGLQFLAGFMHISLYLLMTVSLYVAWRTLMLWRAGALTRARYGFWLFIAAAVVGGCLAGCQLLPTLEAAGLSDRQASYERQVAFRLPPSFVVLGMIPDLMGNPVDNNHWGQWVPEQLRVYTETAWYVGAATWLFALLAVALYRRPATWFWVGMFVLSWLLAMGSGLNAVLYYLVPGYKWLHGIGRVIVIAATAVSILGALGLECVLEAVGQGRRRRLPGMVLGATLGLLIVGWLAWLGTKSFILHHQIQRALPGILPYTAVQVGRFCGLVLAAGILAYLCTTRLRRPALVALIILLALDMGLFIHHFTPAANPAYLHIRTATIPQLRSGREPHRFLSLGKDAVRRLPANQAMRLGLEDIQGSDSLYSGRYRKLLHAASTEILGFVQPDWRLPLMDLLGVRDVICRQALPPAEGFRRLEGQYEVNIYRNEQALPRAYVPATVRRVGTPAEALRIVTSPDFQPRREVIVTSDAADVERQQPAELRIEDYRINRFTIVSDQPWSGLTVIANSFFPGWHAFAGGRQLPVFAVDYTLTGVVVRGASRVDMVYLPTSFIVGGFLTCLATAILACLGTAAWRWRDGR